MNAAQTGIENLDLEKLNDKDKTELRQFLANEQQRSQIQARMCCPLSILTFMSIPACSTRHGREEKKGDITRGRRMLIAGFNAETHNLTQICWKKCVTGNIKGSKLEKGEEGCLANCVDRFLDINFLTMKHLNNMRS
jgi:import inner membrane translocase subunit TIM8